MARSNGNVAKYVYGVVRARGGSLRGERGINDQPVALVKSEGLAALTSDVPDEVLEAGRDELLTHSRVLEKAFERGAVLPMRFGVVMPHEQAVRDELLDPHRVELEGQLDEVDGKLEINLKGIYDEHAILREVLAADREVAALREAIQGKPEDATYYERIRLGELIAEALTAKRSEDERAIVDRLLPCVVAAEVGEAVHERMAVNASFLVERKRLERFDKAVDALGEEQAGRIRLRYTGPLPPHSFVELGIEA
jgi:hypothetical protein